MTSHTVGVTLLSLLLVSCGSGAEIDAGRATEPIAPSVQSSGGVTIYEHTADVFVRAPLIEIDSIPMAVFAGSPTNVDNDLTSLHQFSFLSDGRIAAVDHTVPALVVLDPANGSRRTHGQRGGGPLEFGRSISIVRTAGDTILLGDPGNARFGLASAAEGVLETYPRHFRGGVLGRLPDGSMLLEVHPFPQDAPLAQGAIIGGLLGVIRWHPDSTSADTIDVMPDRPRVIMGLIGEGADTRVRSTMAVRFAAQPQYLVWGQAVLAASGDDWMLSRIEGDSRSEIRVQVPRQAVTDPKIAANIRALVSRLPADAADSVRSVRREFLEAIPSSPNLPAYGDISIAPDGTLWVMDYRSADNIGWAATAFDSSGSVLGRIEVPSGDPPKAFGNGHLLLRTVDDDGIATLSVYRFTMSAE